MIKDERASVVTTYKQDGKRHMKVMYPHAVLDIGSRNELEGLLRYYANPAYTQFGGSPSQNRAYVEFIRPALRFFCKQFGVTIPEWLADDKHYTEMPKEDLKKYFGTSHLNILAFRDKHLEQLTPEEIEKRARSVDRHRKNGRQ